MPVGLGFGYLFYYLGSVSRRKPCTWCVSGLEVVYSVLYHSYRCWLFHLYKTRLYIEPGIIHSYCYYCCTAVVRSTSGCGYNTKKEHGGLGCPLTNHMYTCVKKRRHQPIWLALPLVRNRSLIIMPRSNETMGVVNRSSAAECCTQLCSVQQSSGKRTNDVITRHQKQYHV